jgi:hypothetical protein
MGGCRKKIRARDKNEPIRKITKAKKDWEHLLSKHKALSSNPEPQKKKKG